MKSKKKKKKTKNKRLPLLAKIGLVLVLLGTLGSALILRDVPNPRKLSTSEYPESSQIFDRNDKMLFEIYADIRRVPVTLEDVPEALRQATLAVEDARFYKHWGLDFQGILRGFYRTVFKKRLQGGSTLTQQLVKNALLTPERTLSRKIKEAFLTLATEVIYSKEQILEMYFNQTPYGGTMWGVQAAAKGIFNKDVKELSLAESALLAGLPASPTRYSPFAYPEAAKKRQELVLARMEEEGYINSEERKEANEEKLNYYVQKSSISAPHFVFYVREKLIEEYGIKRVTEGGLKIKTSLDLDLQNYVQGAVASEIATLDRYKISNGAVVVTEPKSGQILAMVGSKDYFAEDIDGKYNVTTALRQPGSSIKPLNYAVGIELGKATAASVFSDNQTCFGVENQKPYCPTNYGYRYFGLQTLRNSLANSLNIPAVKMLKMNGVENFIASASAMGISTFKDPSQYGLSLTLGGGEVMMIDMNTAFGTLANMGIKQELNPILEISDKNGEKLYEYKYIQGDRVLSRETAYIIHDILSDDGARSAVFGRGSLLNIKGHPEVAVKTGTTNDLRDNWTIGYTPDYVVTVWVGNNDNSKMSYVASGITGATPIWHEVMSYLMEDKTVKEPVKPEGVITMKVCKASGGVVPEEGCESYNELFRKEFPPIRQNIAKMAVLINKDTGKVAKEGDDSPNLEWQEHTMFEDISGDKVCLDCPIAEEKKEEDTN
ncbi:MAG: transglycosylase domain-containing protein [Patescibacteria group bacterium]|jgi:1A family penicillin-binding protein